MTEKQFCKGDYTNCRYDICEIKKDDEIICTVALNDADFIIEILNENEQLEKSKMEIANDLGKIIDENEQLKSENDSYKNMFFEIVETALSDTNCRKLYCEGILDIFDKSNSLNQAREMIKEHLK